MTKINILTRTGNRETYFKTLKQSIENQTYKNRRIEFQKVTENLNNSKNTNMEYFSSIQNNIQKTFDDDQNKGNLNNFNKNNYLFLF
mgnify:CR=1 FL=1